MSLLLSILSLVALLPNTVNAAIVTTSLSESFAFLGSMAYDFGILGSLSAYTSIISGDIPHIGSGSVYVQFPDIKVPVLPCDIEIDTSFTANLREKIRLTTLFAGRIISVAGRISSVAVALLRAIDLSFPYNIVLCLLPGVKIVCKNAIYAFYEQCLIKLLPYILGFCAIFDLIFDDLFYTILAHCIVYEVLNFIWAMKNIYMSRRT